MAKYRNLFGEFIEQQRREYQRTYEYWAERWTEMKRKRLVLAGLYNEATFKPLNPGTISRWAKGDRRIGASHRFIFADLPFTMDQYYDLMPPSDQTQTRNDVRKYGRTRAKANRAREKKRTAGVVTIHTAKRTIAKTQPAAESVAAR